MENKDIFGRKDEDIWAACTHTKPNGSPAIGGQRIHLDDKLHTFVCLYCQKTWDHDDLPPELWLPMNYVGGPIEYRHLSEAESAEWQEAFDEYKAALNAVPPEVPAEEIEALFDHYNHVIKRLTNSGEL